MLSPTSVDELRAIGLAAGLHRVGVASAEPFDEVRVTLESRKAAGLHGGMQFSYRNPARSTEPGRVVAGARSLVVGALAYPAAVAQPTAAEAMQGPLARVARYATSDHYAELRRALEAMAARLRTDGWVARVVADDNALVDRAAAHRAGIGWYGKNANLLIEGAGSWFVLGSVVTDAPLAEAQRESPQPLPMAHGCGTCTRCLTGCPTGAIVEPGVVDARRCLAWLVQAEGMFPIEHRVALGDRLYGCDECQEVCPPSVRTMRHEVPSPTEQAWVPLLEILAAGDDELLAAHGRWYVPRRDPDYLRRNALIALGNAAPVPVDAAVRAAVARHCAHPRAMLRAHAVWAARRLGLHDCVDPMQDDPDPLVRAELAADVPSRAGSPPPAAPPLSRSRPRPSRPGAPQR